jgi:hypothetical protein
MWFKPGHFTGNSFIQVDENVWLFNAAVGTIQPHFT